MNFNYPDWKIYDDIAISLVDDCTYNFRFTTINPHFADLGIKNKEVIVMQLRYTDDFKKFSVTTIRGTVY